MASSFARGSLEIRLLEVARYWNRLTRKAAPGGVKNIYKHGSSRHGWVVMVVLGWFDDLRSYFKSKLFCDSIKLQKESQSHLTAELKSTNQMWRHRFVTTSVTGTARRVDFQVP